MPVTSGFLAALVVFGLAGAVGAEAEVEVVGVVPPLALLLLTSRPVHGQVDDPRGHDHDHGADGDDQLAPAGGLDLVATPAALAGALAGALRAVRPGRPGPPTGRAAGGRVRRLGWAAAVPGLTDPGPTGRGRAGPAPGWPDLAAPRCSGGPAWSGRRSPARPGPSGRQARRRPGSRGAPARPDPAGRSTWSRRRSRRGPGHDGEIPGPERPDRLDRSGHPGGRSRPGRNPDARTRRHGRFRRRGRFRRPSRFPRAAVLAGAAVLARAGGLLAGRLRARGARPRRLIPGGSLGPGHVPARPGQLTAGQGRTGLPLSNAWVKKSAGGGDDGPRCGKPFWSGAKPFWSGAKPFVVRREAVGLGREGGLRRSARPRSARLTSEPPRSAPDGFTPPKSDRPKSGRPKSWSSAGPDPPQPEPGPPGCDQRSSAPEPSGAGNACVLSSGPSCGSHVGLDGVSQPLICAHSPVAITHELTH